jgi:flagellar hook-length control protein FliK
MQVNANSKVQTTNPLEGMIADKSQAQSAEAAFAAVLAKAGLNIQAGLSASLQAPSSLAQAVDKPYRAEAKDQQRSSDTREPQGRAVARGRDDDKTTGQDRANEVRPADKPAQRAEKTERPDKSKEAADGDETAQSQAPTAETTDESQVSESAAPASQAQAEVTSDSGQSAIVAEAEETVAVAMAAFVAAPVQQVEVKAVSEQSVASDETVVVQGDDGAEVALAQNASGPQKPAEIKHEAKKNDVQGQQASEETIDPAVLVMSHAAKAVKQTKNEAEVQVQAAQTGVDALKNEQAAMLSAIVGDKGTAKVEVAAKGLQTGQQSASALSVGLLAAETQTQQAVAGMDSGFGEGADLDGNMMQNNAGQKSSATAPTVNMPNGAQLGATASAAVQGPASNFQAALASAQTGAGGEGGNEIQGVQGAGNSQAATQTQQSGQGMAPQQTANEARASNAAHAAEKPHEAKAPQQAKEILDQVNVQISKAAKEGLDKITVQMRPEALGRVEVQLKLGDNGQLSAHIIADKAETLDALKRDSSQLEKSLADAGFKTDQGSLQFSLRGEQQNNQQKAGDGKGVPFFERGQALDEAAPEETIAAARPRAASRSGVDISV